VKGGRGIEAKRLISRKEGQRSESVSLMLRFEKVLLGKVQLGFLSFNVRDFVPYALQCFKCQRTVHVAAQCKGKKRCAKCGGAHDYGECGSNVKCCNCGGEHSAAFDGCQVQREAQRSRISHDVSYAVAIKPDWWNYSAD
jgi:hypothetical protein